MRALEEAGVITGYHATVNPAALGRAFRVDITGRNGGHLSFGHGIHYCVGAPLARLIAEIAFTSLLAACTDLTLATDDLAWRPSPFNRGLRRLPIRFGSLSSRPGGSP